MASSLQTPCFVIALHVVASSSELELSEYVSYVSYVTGLELLDA